MRISYGIYIACALSGVFCSSCATTSTGGYEGLRLIDRHEEFCLYAEKKLSFDPVRYLVIDKECESKKFEIREAIFVDSGVNLSAKDFSSAIAFLRSFTADQCERNKDALFNLCLKDELPNVARFEAGAYVFWYGRDVYHGSSGTPYALSKNGDAFSLAPAKP